MKRIGLKLSSIALIITLLLSFGSYGCTKTETTTSTPTAAATATTTPTPTKSNIDVGTSIDNPVPFGEYIEVDTYNGRIKIAVVGGELSEYGTLTLQANIEVLDAPKASEGVGIGPTQLSDQKLTGRLGKIYSASNWGAVWELRAGDKKTLTYEFYRISEDDSDFYFIFCPGYTDKNYYFQVVL